MQTWTLVRTEQSEDGAEFVSELGPFDKPALERAIIANYIDAEQWMVYEWADGIVLSSVAAVEWLDEHAAYDFAAGNDVRLFGTNEFRGVANLGGVCLDYSD